MKILVLAILSLTFVFEASAQRRPGPGPRYNPPRRHSPSYPGPRYNPPGRYSPRHPGPVVVRPRYVPRPYSPRYVRTVRRPPIIWTIPFGYACGAYNELLLNGRVVHDFGYAQECQQAIQDIRVYGDFCDREDLYDQSGILEAQFTFDYECRNALGWYY